MPDRMIVTVDNDGNGIIEYADYTEAERAERERERAKAQVEREKAQSERERVKRARDHLLSVRARDFIQQGDSLSTVAELRAHVAQLTRLVMRLAAAVELNDYDPEEGHRV